VARPLSEEKQAAILASATRVIAAEGVGAPTAKIAQEAGVASGTLFTYFANKDLLLNDLYRSIKAEIAEAILVDYPEHAPIHARARHVWDRYVAWGLRENEKRQAMSQLAVSHRVSHDVMEHAFEPLAVLSSMLSDCVDKTSGLSGQHVAAIMTALASVALDFAARDPANAARHGDLCFAAFCRAVAKP
jgi:AcrR family transcriptional regulator